MSNYLNTPDCLNDGQANAWSSIKSILENLEPASDGKAIMISLDGCAGSGKTFFANQLYQALVKAYHADLGQVLSGSAKRSPLAAAVITPTHRARVALIDKGFDASKVSTIRSAIYEAHFIPDILEKFEYWLNNHEEDSSGRLDLWPFDNHPFPDSRKRSRALTTWKVEGEHFEELTPFAKRTALQGAAQILGVNLLNYLDTSVGDSGWLPSSQKVADILIVDEASMVTVGQGHDLRAVCRVLILVGDVMQLPPVVDGEEVSGIADRRQALLHLNAFPDVRRLFLQQAMRQGDDPGGQDVLDLANWLRDQGLKRKRITPKDFVERAKTYRHGVTFTNQFPQHIVKAGAALCWRNYIRIAINMGAIYDGAAGRCRDYLKVGDPIIVTGSRLPKETCEEMGLVRNSLWWVCKAADEHGFVRITNQQPGKKEAREPREIAVALEIDEDWNQVNQYNEKRETSLLARDMPFSQVWTHPGHHATVWANHGSACTIHRAQGGEYDEVGIHLKCISICAFVEGQNAQKPGYTPPVDGIPEWMKLAYTALTRARHKVYLVDGVFVEQEDV